MPDPIIDPPAPIPSDDAIQKAKFEADAARAEVAKMKQQVEELLKNQPTVEQRTKWAALEEQDQQTEEQRKRKEGEFDAWRIQLTEKSNAQLAAERENTQAEKHRAEAIERELNDRLVGLAFASATEWFGSNGKTVLLPDFAKSYFGNQVHVEVIPGVGSGPSTRRVVVLDSRGAVIVDPNAKGSVPMPFEKAIGEVIEAHPQKDQLMRGSGKVGAGSSGGGNGPGSIDTSRLKAADFKDPAVRQQVRNQLEQTGGLKIGPGFDALRTSK